MNSSGAIYIPFFVIASRIAMISIRWMSESCLLQVLVDMGNGGLKLMMESSEL
jgi:hypothetical protein